MSERGKIRNRKFATQIRDFSGLRFGNITPTDIDAFLDFRGELFIIIESKYGNASMPKGQQLALERLCDACQDGGVDTYVLVGSFMEDGDIDYANIKLEKYRYKGKWEKPVKERTIKNTIDFIRENRIRLAS